MAKYRKKPVVVEAFQWQGTTDHGLPDWIWVQVQMGFITFDRFHLNIKTMEGTMVASPGDYIIKGIKGELYPCKPEIFEATYEKVED